jgi:LEA14-like dessication related protein
MSRLLAALSIAGLLLVSSGCQKPAPPRITPKLARVEAITPQGLDILVQVEAVNPNRVTLSAQSFSGKAKLDGKWELGSVTVAKPVVLPPNVPTMIDVPMAMPWTDVKTLAALALAQHPVPYVVEGTVKIGGERLNVDVPFSLTGTITREQIANAALRSLPTIPGLQGLPR